jgi:hypothetical protein
MPDTVRVGNDPANGTIQVLGESGDVRASLSVKQTVATIASRAAREGNGVAGINLGTFPGVVRPDRQNSSDNIGELELFGSSDQVSARLSGSGTGSVGGGGAEGSFTVLSASGETVLYAGTNGTQALLMLGGPAVSGHILLCDQMGRINVVLDGQSGDISIGNADCAEEFDVEDDVAPGAVVSIGACGRLMLARAPYDPRVVGIVSGLGCYRPGLVLDARATGRKRAPIAVIGKVMCMVDADQGPVRAGSLLTTSSRPGYAMVVQDPQRAFGCVIGKSLSEVTSGIGVAQVLVMNR